MSEFESKRENRVKLYGVLIGVFSALFQHVFYVFGNAAAQLIGITPVLTKIPAIDNAIPIIPIFIIPYAWAYIFWAMAPMAVSKCKFDHFLDYLAAYLFACIAGMLILIFFPTYMSRVAEGLFDLPRTGILYRLMNFWYMHDGGAMAYNLFPSFHCLNSTISYLGVAGRDEVPKWFRVYSFIVMILVFLATVFVKQHYVVDIFGGVAVALISFYLCEKFRAGRIFLPLIRFFKKLFGKERSK